ncbi:MAG: S8 family serine peptidase, partial [Bacteroidota bacterium]
MKYPIPLCLLCCTLLSTGVLAQGTRARSEVRLDEVYATYDLSGEGVLVVMIDRGIDYHHPAFLKADGTTRLAYVFDMINDSGANAPDNPYGVGTIFDADDINGDLMTDGPPLSNDNHGHGTATTSIMAGNGGGANGVSFGGAAPEATIISVKLVQDGFPADGGSPGETGFFNPDYIAIALQFARDKIEELGLPSVTLLNIGSIGGPTDGSSTVGRALTEFATDHPFVCGVGDDGGVDNFATGTVDQGETVNIRFQKSVLGNMDLDLWYPADARFRVRLITPNGTVIAPASPGNNSSSTQESGDNNNVTIWHHGADRDFWGSTSDRREVFIRIADGVGPYTLELTGNTASNSLFQATINPGNFSRTNRFLDFGSNEGSINDYSASPGVVSPGDYVLNNSWPSALGSTFSILNQGDPGELWLGSSKGPTQDGRLGIDFVAPGEVLYGAYS